MSERSWRQVVSVLVAALGPMMFLGCNGPRPQRHDRAPEPTPPPVIVVPPTPPPEEKIPPPNLIVPYVPSPMAVVEAMLETAKVGKDDVVYDLGCGDGRIVIAAVKKCGARKGVGIDLNPQRIKESKANAEKEGPPPNLIVPYVPSPMGVVEAMLETAKVGKDDVVYDLGCGDGRIVIAAVKKYGAQKGVGIDLNPQRIKESKENAEKEGVVDKVEFRLGDILDADLKPASVVTCYLLPRVNLMVRPIMFRDLKPGCRVVSHAFTMAEWREDLPVVRPKDSPYNNVYFWYIPAPVGGTWEWAMKAKDAEAKCSLALTQEFQAVKGALVCGDDKPVAIADVALKGRDFSFTAPVKMGGDPVKVTFKGVADGDAIQGEATWEGGKQPWAARRTPIDLAGTWKVTAKAADDKLDGTLAIERKNGVLTATYTFEKDKKVQPIKAFYAWGTSLRFDVPGEPDAVFDFKGSFGADAATGTVGRESSGLEAAWAAQRAK